MWYKFDKTRLTLVTHCLTDPLRCSTHDKVLKFPYLVDVTPSGGGEDALAPDHLA